MEKCPTCGRSLANVDHRRDFLLTTLFTLFGLFSGMGFGLNYWLVAVFVLVGWFFGLVMSVIAERGANRTVSNCARAKS